MLISWRRFASDVDGAPWSRTWAALAQVSKFLS